jgi:formylglycine-generating enzyme required for sulfatase activity
MWQKRLLFSQDMVIYQLSAGSKVMRKEISNYQYLAIFFLGWAVLIGHPVVAQNGRGVGVVVRNQQGMLEKRLLYKGSYALIIGNSEYETWPDLPGVREDIVEIEKALVKHNFIVEKALNITKTEFREKLDKFISDFGQTPENRLLIYYAGHGYTTARTDGKGNMGYLVMRDAPSMPEVNLSIPLPEKKISDFRLKAISMTEIENAGREIQSNHVLFAFDSCFSGTVLYRETTGIPSFISLEELKPVREFLTAGSESQVVSDNSPFRRAFVEGINGKADSDRDGYILGTELQLYVKKEVTKESNGKQTPLFGKQENFNRGDFIFVLNSMSLVTSFDDKPVPSFETNRADPKQIEAEAYSKIYQSSNPDDFKKFLELFPNGANAENARLKWEQVWWAKIKSSSDPNDFQNFLQQFPSGQYNKLARLTLSKLQATNLSEISDLAKERPLAFKNSIGMEFVRIEAGTFFRGSEKGNGDEKPMSRIFISEPFYLGKFEVTQREWKLIMGTKPSYFNKCGEDCPVEDVSFEQVQQFLEVLSEKENRYYRLPTEAEWEYACRAGTTTEFSTGDSLSSKQANINGSDLYIGKTVRVGSYQPNNWGLYDMHGNVWEWCEDWYGPYSNETLKDPNGPEKGTKRIVRGGSWFHGATYARSANRNINSINVRNGIIGFRVLLEQ